MEQLLSKPRGWLAGRWHGPCGLKELLQLALPLVVSMLSFALNQFFDRLFLTWYSQVAVGAVLTAGAFAWVTYSFPLGLTMYTTAFVAQYYGARQFHRIGQVIWHALYFSMATIPIFLAVGVFAPQIFAAFGHNQAMQTAEATYFRILSYSLGITIAAEALSAYFIGIGKTSRVMTANVICAAANILLDYPMIFGKWGFPEMGLAGAAWATTIANWLKFAVLLAMVCRSRAIHGHGLTSQWRFSRTMLARLLRYGSPQGFHFFLEGGAVTIFIILTGSISVTAAAAASIALSVNMVAFVPLFGLGTALTTLVGREIGRQQIQFARRATRSTMAVGTLYAAVFAGLYLFWPSLFVGVHEIATGAQKPEVQMARWLLRFVAAYCVFDAFQILFQAAIKGAGDTFFVMLVTIMSSAAFVGAGAIGARFFATENGQIIWWWSCLTGWVVALSVVYSLRYWGGKWTRMSVIERELIAPQMEAVDLAAHDH
jgi:MATE family multidrug resistance protein